jgi:hypothetical protein
MEAQMSQLSLRPTDFEKNAFGQTRRLIFASEPSKRCSDRHHHVHGLLGYAAATRLQGKHIRNWILVLPTLVLGSIIGVAQAGSFGPQSVGTTSGGQNVTITAQTAGTVVKVKVLTVGVEGLDFAPNTTGETCGSATLGVGDTCTESVTFTPA